VDPRYNALQFNTDSVITRLRSSTPTFHGLAKAA